MSDTTAPAPYICDACTEEIDADGNCGPYCPESVDGTLDDDEPAEPAAVTSTAPTADATVATLRAAAARAELAYGEAANRRAAAYGHPGPVLDARYREEAAAHATWLDAHNAYQDAARIVRLDATKPLTALRHRIAVLCRAIARHNGTERAEVLRLLLADRRNDLDTAIAEHTTTG